MRVKMWENLLNYTLKKRARRMVSNKKLIVFFSKKEAWSEFQKESALLQELILQAPYFETFDAFEAYLAQKSALSGEALFKPLRFWLTGAEDGLDLELIYPLIKNYLKEIVRWLSFRHLLKL